MRSGHPLVPNSSEETEAQVQSVTRTQEWYCALHHAALQASSWGHSEGTPVALSPNASPKTPVPLPHLPATSGYMQEPVQKAPAPCPYPTPSLSTPGDTHLPPFLSPRDLGAGEAHWRHTPGLGTAPPYPTRWPCARPPRRLGGTWEKEKQRSCPSAQVSHFQGPVWAVLPGLEGRSRLPPFASFWASGPIPDRPSGAVWTWEWPQRPHPGRAQELYSL